MPAEVETMFSAVETPWHRLGVVTDNPLDSADAMGQAGLDWTVSLRELATFQDVNNTDVSSLIDVPNHYATVRDSDNTVLGVVGNRYRPIQNLECFNFLDNVLDDTSARYETAGSLYNGKVVWMLLNLGKDIVVGEDKTVPYLLLTNSHDGSSSIKGITTPIRVVCANTLSLALKNHKTGFSFRHTANAMTRVDEARKLLELNYLYIDDFQKEVEKMIDTQLTRTQFNDIIDNLFPEIELNDTGTNHLAVDRSRVTRARVEHLFDNPEFSEQTGSAWSLINAVSNYEQWVAPVRKITHEERIANKTINGTQSPMLDRAYDMLRGMEILV
jgi:phage/plasmid-like protein (TIGR03299 family)